MNSESRTANREPMIANREPQTANRKDKERSAVREERYAVSEGAPMPATILTADHYDAVRALIAPDVTDAHISDAYLSQQPFAPEAERKVRKRLVAAGVDMEHLTGDVLADARLAMMHECASVLCLTAPQLLRQTELQVVTEVQSVDWKEKRQFHQSQVIELVDDVIASFETRVRTQQPSRALPFGAVGTQR